MNLRDRKTELEKSIARAIQEETSKFEKETELVVTNIELRYMQHLPHGSRYPDFAALTDVLVKLAI